jgi:hypothetical protein
MKFLLGSVSAFAVAMAASCGGEEGSAELQKEAAAAEALSTSCDGVMPGTTPTSWTHSSFLSDGSACGVNTSDASGNVMLESTLGPGEFQDFESDHWDIFTAVGHLRGAVQQNDHTRIFPQQWGFQTLGDQNGCGLNPNCQPQFGLRAWTANGALIKETAPTFPVFDSALDLAGGVALVGLRPQQPFTIVSQRFDAHSSPLAQQAVIAKGTTQPIFIATGVSVSGLSLVLWNGDFSGFPADALVGRWVDRFGQARTGTFVVARNLSFGNIPAGVSATPLVDGSMAIRAHPASPSNATAQAWVAIVPSGSTAVSAVPGWLATRPDARVFIVRGGRAYALLFPIDRSTCGPAHVALFAPAGNRCGGFDLDSGAPGPTCALDSNIGRDGTLIVRGETGAAQVNCKDRVFPALLQ